MLPPLRLLGPKAEAEAGLATLLLRLGHRSLTPSPRPRPRRMCHQVQAFGKAAHETSGAVTSLAVAVCRPASISRAKTQLFATFCVVFGFSTLT